MRFCKFCHLFPPAHNGLLFRKAEQDLTCAQDVLHTFEHGASVYSLIRRTLTFSSIFLSNWEERARMGIEPRTSRLTCWQANVLTILPASFQLLLSVIYAKMRCTGIKCLTSLALRIGLRPGRELLFFKVFLGEKGRRMNPEGRI